MYCVYLFQNKLNDKIYVGKTKDFKKRVWRHINEATKNISRKTYFRKAISKYGIDQFNYFVIEEFENEQDSLEAETFWILFFQSNKSEFGYNLTIGGEGTSGYKQTEEHKKKNSEAKLGSKNWNYGKPMSQDHKKNISHAKISNRESNQPYYDKLSILYSGDKTNFAKIRESNMRIIINQWI